jgi:mono/diheme cytochrome c family protein
MFPIVCGVLVCVCLFQAGPGVGETGEVRKETLLAEKGGTEETEKQIPTASTPAELFVTFECKTCHLIPGMAPDEGEGELGPDLNGIHEKGAKRVEGKGLKEYLRESILDPNAFIIPDFDPDVMPADYGDRMTEQEVEAIVDYLSVPHENPSPPEPETARSGSDPKVEE